MFTIPINKQKLRKVGKISAGIFLVFFCVFLGILYRVDSVATENVIISKVTDLPKKNVGLVFGAGYRGGTVSGILADRLDVAVDAYARGKIQVFLLSGDNSSAQHNEVAVMKNYLLRKGIDKEDIYLDYAGFDTYDSLYRARDIFGVSSLTLFTQKYHLKRALYIAKNLGMDATGCATDLHEYANINYFLFRELGAKVKAFWEVEIIHASPRFLGKQILIRTLNENHS